MRNIGNQYQDGNETCSEKFGHGAHLTEAKHTTISNRHLEKNENLHTESLLCQRLLEQAKYTMVLTKMITKGRKN